MCEAWYVLNTIQYKEEFVAAQLSRKGIALYYPTIPHPRYVGKVKPFFPGYLFVQADLSRVGIHTFNRLPGSRGLVQFGEWTAVVEGAVITAVAGSVAAWVARGEGELVRGTAVEITSGPFAGYDGVFERYRSGRKRVQVLIEMLGRRVTVGSGSVLRAWV